MTCEKCINALQCFESPTLGLLNISWAQWSLITIMNVHHYESSPNILLGSKRSVSFHKTKWTPFPRVTPGSVVFPQSFGQTKPSVFARLLQPTSPSGPLFLHMLVSRASIRGHFSQTLPDSPSKLSLPHHLLSPSCLFCLCSYLKSFILHDYFSLSPC